MTLETARQVLHRTANLGTRFQWGFWNACFTLQWGHQSVNPLAIRVQSQDREKLGYARRVRRKMPGKCDSLFDYNNRNGLRYITGAILDFQLKWGNR